MSSLIDVVIKEKVALSDLVLMFRLEMPDGSPLPEFTPGAHVDVKIYDELTRQYSLCSSSKDIFKYNIAVLRDSSSRGGSERIHRDFQVGQIIQISSPRNLFKLHNHHGQVLLVAGGIGITPLLSMAISLIEQNKSFTLCYVHSSSGNIPFSEILTRPPFTDNVVFINSNSRLETRERLEKLIPKFESDDGLYTCGPSGFMDMVYDVAASKAWPAEALNKEAFKNEVVASAGDQPFTLELEKSQIRIPVRADQTALEALDEAGVEVDASCEQGICGTCLLNVLDGQVDHRDAYLTDDEKQQHNQFTPCCSRALTSTLTIDL